MEAKADALAANGDTKAAETVRQMAEESKGISGKQMLALRSAGTEAGIEPKDWIAEAIKRYALNGNNWAKEMSLPQYEEMLSWLQGQKKS
jgi:hypothetical protein